MIVVVVAKCFQKVMMRMHSDCQNLAAVAAVQPESQVAAVIESLPLHYYYY